MNKLLVANRAAAILGAALCLFMGSLTSPLSDHILPSQGSRQTYHWPDHGPTFGAVPDLFVDKRLTIPISRQLSYGDPAFKGRSIIDANLTCAC